MDTFGIGRSMEPAHSLPQQAWRIDNTTELRPDELLIDVKIVSINLVSFNEIWDETGGNDTLLCQRVMEIIQERCKLHNPVTNTGGMLYGKVAQMGSEYPNLYGLAPGDEIISLASLSITPLKLDRILCVDYACAQLTVEGRAILYASSPVVKRPPDIPLQVVISAMDEAGVSACTHRIVEPGQSVLVLGAGGRSGLLCGYAARDKMKSSGRLVGIVRNENHRQMLERYGVYDEVLALEGAPPGMQPEQQVLDALGEEELTAMILGLREPYRTPCRLVLLEQHTMAEAAQLCGRPPKTVEAQIYRAKKMLAQQILQRENDGKECVHGTV